MKSKSLPRIKELIQALNLQPHPEGGFYAETYRSAGSFGNGKNGFPQGRPYSTAICYLLGGYDTSSFHRIKSDEIWHHYEGGALHIHIIHPDGKYEVKKLGKNQSDGERFQAVVPAGCWFGAKPADPDSYVLSGCTVAPGFLFEDFEMADTEVLCADFPQHEGIIRELAK